jgi:predicted SAM-dependent methyltransferase
MRVYVGCGAAPIPGWRNFDNSLTVRLAARPLLAKIAFKIGGLSPTQKCFFDIVRANGIRWANVAKRIPLNDESVEVLYTCHMLEHLDREEAHAFLKESKRVLQPGGILRVAVPDIRAAVSNYLESGDADQFIEDTHLTIAKPVTLRKKITHIITGARHHHWMYDEESLKRLLMAGGFDNVMSLTPGNTTISNPKGLNLYDRHPGTIYVEARKCG